MTAVGKASGAAARFQVSAIEELATGTDVKGFYAQHFWAAIFPLVGGALLYGWAALCTVAIVMASAAAGLVMWKRIGRRGRQLNAARCLWMAMLLSLALPPHLLSPHQSNWPVVPAAGIFLVIVEWLLATVGSGRVDPVVAAYLMLVVLFEPILTPHLVLKFDHVLLGNLFNARMIDAGVPRTIPWISATDSPPSGTDALDDPQPAASVLSAYTSGRLRPDRFITSAQMVLRDQLPPLEDMVVGGEPGPIGASSGALVIVGGLLLIYKGLIDYRIPLLCACAALAAFLILPVPEFINDSGPQWRLAWPASYLGWEASVALAGYELFTSPLLFVALFLATSPRSRPMSRRGCAAQGVILGLLAAPMQLYGSILVGPYVALLTVSLGSRVLDRIFPPRALV